VQVHRLDEATGGLLLVAKTRLGLQGLSSSFEQRQVLHFSMLTPPLCLPKRKQTESLHVDASTTVAHDTLVWKADKSAVEYHDQ